MDKQKIKVLCENFFYYWKNRNFNAMLNISTKTFKHTKGNSDIKTVCKALLENPMQTKIIKITNCVYDVGYSIQVNGERKNVLIRVLKEKAPFVPDENGEWGVYPLSLRVDK